MNDLLFIAMTLICACIIVACICRVNRMCKTDRFGFVVMYAMYAGMACAALIDMFRHIDAHVVDSLSTGEWVALAGIGLNLILTRRSWLNGARPEIVKKSCRSVEPQVGTHTPHQS
jgi:hypothetical protein